MGKIRWFPLSVVASFILFLSCMAYVVIVTAQRQYNGSMGIDAAKIQKMRVEANEKERALYPNTLKS